MAKDITLEMLLARKQQSNENCSFQFKSTWRNN